MALAILVSSVSANAAKLCQLVLANPPEKRESMTELKVALVQYRIAYDQTYDQFLQRQRHEVKKAVENGAQLIVFPELAIYDLVPNSISDDVREKTAFFRNMAAEISERYFVDMKRLSQEFHIHVLAGSAPILDNQSRILNRAMLFFADGTYTSQDKNFLTPEEREYGWSNGSGQIQTFATPWGKSAIMICHDCEFAHLSQQLSAEMPEVILVPSMTSNEHGRNRVLWTGMARAVEHYAYALVVGTAGEPEDFFGQATVISPQDGAFPARPASGVINEHEQFYYTLDLAKLRRQRLMAPIYPARDFVQRNENDQSK